MTSSNDGRSEALELRECARGSPDFYAATAAQDADGDTTAVADSTSERSEARNGARSTSRMVALAAAGSEAANRRGRWSCH